jgi:hypothetical protein
LFNCYVHNSTIDPTLSTIDCGFFAPLIHHLKVLIPTLIDTCVLTLDSDCVESVLKRTATPSSVCTHTCTHTHKPCSGAYIMLVETSVV